MKNMKKGLSVNLLLCRLTSISSILFLSALLALIPIAAAAQQQEIDAGVTWLLSDQNPSGSWGDPELTELRDTMVIADVLKQLGQTDAQYAYAISFIENILPENTDYVARKASILTQEGIDVSELTDELVAAKRPEGGWGASSQYTADNLDTALALRALKLADYPDAMMVGVAAGFLTENQNTDGGWGFSPNYESNVYVTAMVLSVLAELKDTYDLEAPINNGAAYLLTKQNADGGFGASPSTVYETALTLEALVASGADIFAEAPLAASYLISTQLPEGSWDEDPYDTALAIRALSKVKPNLSISSADISFSVTMPQEGEPVTIFATVWNKGIEEASDVAVRFFLGDPSAGGVQIGTDQMIASLAPGASAQASVTDSFTGTGGKTIFVQVDPEDIISETAESDNEASTRLWIATGPDLAVFSEELVPSTYIPAPDEPFALEYTVRNIGETTVDETFVSVYDGDPSQGGVYLDGAPLYGLDGGTSRTGTFGVTLSETGSHTLYVVVDYNNQVPEVSESNNTATCAVQVGGTQQMADLSVRTADIVLTPSRPTAGETASGNGHPF
jgi:hypothetical protein